jgi:hypothetical protein
MIPFILGGHVCICFFTCCPASMSVVHFVHGHPFIGVADLRQEGTRMIPFFHGADLLPRFTAPLDGFKEQVRAITINDEARTEFELDKDIGALSGSLEDVFIAQVIPNTHISPSKHPFLAWFCSPAPALYASIPFWLFYIYLSPKPPIPHPYVRLTTCVCLVLALAPRVSFYFSFYVISLHLFFCISRNKHTDNLPPFSVY